MATTLRRFRSNNGLAPDAGPYLPSQKEIAEKTAEIRQAKRKRNQAIEREKEQAALNRLSKSRKIKKREMTKADICNVESVSQEELTEMLNASVIREVDNRWTTTEEGQQC